MPAIISRQDAQAHGLLRYFTGKPCKHGHITERRTDNSDCFGCLKVRKEKPHPKRTAEQNRQRNERLAQQRREMHADDASSIKRQALAGLGHVMQAAEAQERSKRLDDMIRAGRNYVR